MPKGYRFDPTVPSPRPDSLNSALLRNIEALRARRSEEERQRSLQDKSADIITRFAGSMLFVYIHLVAYGGWILINTGVLPILPAWDETLVILAMAASVEAIFLSTFVLISQNRMAALADQRADLDVQISLLTEHEVTTLVRLVRQMAQHMGLRVDAQEVSELERNVAPEAVLDAIEEAEDTGPDDKKAASA